MRVDLATQTFKDLTAEEFQELGELVEKLVVFGEFSERLKYYFSFWCQELHFDDRQGLMLMATAFPQRALLSLLYLSEIL